MTKSTNRLKIGFVLDDGLDKPDGVQQNILTLGKWLTDAGHEVKYLVGQTRRRDLPGLITLSRNLKVSFNGNRLSIPFFSSAGIIKSVIEKEKFDVIHVQVPYSPLMSGRLIKNLDSKTALIGTFHILPAGSLSYWATKALGKILTRTLNKFDRHLAVSEPARIFAKESFHINCEVLPNPVDIGKYKKPKKPNFDSVPIKIIFLGRLVSRKGCEYLVRAVRRMESDDPPKNKYHLDICGNGPLKNKLTKYVSDNNLSNLVMFHGFVSESRKITMLRQADIAVFPSTSGESFGIVLAEAMAANGGVVIAGDNPGYRSVLGNLPESLVDPMQIDRFSRVLASFIDSPSNRSRLHTKQQALAAKFDVGVVGGKLLKIYNDCISTKKSG